MAFFNCIARLNKAAGRKLSDAEVQDIFERINKASNDIKAGRIKPDQDGALDQVINQAAQEAAKTKIVEAKRLERNAALQVIKITQRANDIKAMEAAGITPIGSMKRLIAIEADGKANQFSLESREMGIVSEYKRRLQDTWVALGNDFLGFLQNRQNIELLFKEMRGEDTGNALAKKGAEAWINTMESMRKRFNSDGGGIGKLEDWAIPQHHSQELVARAGKPKWIDSIFPALARDKYIDDAGVPMTEPAIKEFLSHAWDTIATNGHNDATKGFTGKGAAANRHRESRVIHFKDAESQLNYWDYFGEKTFHDVLMSHVDSMAKDMALVQHFGPNPEASYLALRNEARAKQSLENPTKLAKTDREVSSLDNLWNVASGKTLPVADRRVANFFDVMHGLNVAGKLGGAFWSSLFGDKVMLETASHLNNLPMIQRWRNEMRILNPLHEADREQLQRQGLMLDYMRTAMNRWGDSMGQSSLTGKLASAVMRVSGMNAINEWRKGAFGLTMMSTLGKMIPKEFKEISKNDMRLIKNYGITEADWRLWKLAELEDYGHGNDTMLTPDNIAKISDEAIKAEFGEVDPQRMREDSIVKLLGSINSESKYAIVEPGWRTRAELFSNLQRGKVIDELVRSFWQFKSFPIAQIERQWDLAMSRPSFGGKAGVMASIMVMQFIAGALIIQTREMLSGKDPRKMRDWKFALASFFQGGSLGIYGDFIQGITQANKTDAVLSGIKGTAGPTIGAVIDIGEATVKAANRKAAGKETHLAANYLKTAKGFVPANNLWYTKAATDHLIFQNIQENLSPGYLSSIRANTMKNTQQDWWWQPGQTSPNRAPNLEKAFQ